MSSGPNGKGPMMTIQRELHQTLSAMMQLIEGGRSAPDQGPGLVDHLHYLEQRSDAKALDFLEGRDGTLAPNC